MGLVTDYFPEGEESIQITLIKEPVEEAVYKQLRRQAEWVHPERDQIHAARQAQDLADKQLMQRLFPGRTNWTEDDVKRARTIPADSQQRLAANIARGSGRYEDGNGGYTRDSPDTRKCPEDQPRRKKELQRYDELAAALAEESEQEPDTSVAHLQGFMDCQEELKEERKERREKRQEEVAKSCKELRL